MSGIIDPALPPARGLFDPALGHDACGVGFIAHVKNRKSHQIVQQGLQILLNLDHRGAVGADPKLGDGCGILVQISHGFFAEECAKTATLSLRVNALLAFWKWFKTVGDTGVLPFPVLELSMYAYFRVLDRDGKSASKASSFLQSWMFAVFVCGFDDPTLAAT